MQYNHPEIKLIVKVLAIVGAVVIILTIGGYIFLKMRAPHFLQFSKNIDEIRVEVSLDTLKDARFVQGMSGCENLLLSPYNSNVYVSCLDGNIYLLSRLAGNEYSVIKSRKPGNQALGMAMGRDRMLYVNVAEGNSEEWTTVGGGIFSFTPDLEIARRVTANYSALNGLACDGSGNLYFTSSNFNYFHPEGKVFRMEAQPDGFGEPVVFLEDAGVSNGLYYSEGEDKIYYSNTLGGVYWFGPEDPQLHETYLKLRFMEACDDLCTDIGGNIWMTDPGYSTVKMYNPGTNRLYRFDIKGIGQTSSCRIRTEDGLEMLYITELKKEQKPMKKEWDGRGVLIVPTRSLIRLVEAAQMGKSK